MTKGIFFHLGVQACLKCLEWTELVVRGGNESLTYTAPKQPKRKDTGGGESGAAQSTGVTSATVVHAYKLVDNQYASQGKVGAAILTNRAAHEYRILLYISKQQQLTNVKITPTFAFNVQTNNYANFYDEARVNWSIMFTSAQDAEKFAKEVGLFKAVVAGGQLSTVVQQDMRMGEGGGLENGDSVETKYTGWLLANNTFGQVFDSNTSSDKLFRLKVGKGKVIKGWDQGMLGMRKGGKRLLVIPPGLAYGAQGVPDRVPANSTLIFEVEVVRVKLQKGEATAEATQPPAPAAAPAVNPMPVGEEVPDVNLGDDVVKERSRSITEQLSHQSPKSDKAKLISRMAKMGQPMLPNMSGAVPAQPDSEEEPPSPQPTTGKPQLPTKPHTLHTNPQSMAHAQVPLSGQPVAQPYAQPVPQPVAQPAMAPMDMHGVASAQPAFLQNLPGAQQLAVYQPQPTLLQQQQQQQQAMLTMQQQQMGGVPMATSQPPGYMPQATPLSVHALAASSAGLGPSSSTSDAMAPLLLSETRQQNTEMRMAVGKMSDKVDRILEKMDTLSTQGGQRQPLPAPTMETSILLHNITRIIQENERLKKEVFERGEKIETQNDKIAELLQKNQRYVEKSNTLLEERNEGYKLTANQSQSRILALEQEKVQMATELSSTTAQLATLQLELGELRKKEGALRQQLQSSSSSSASHQEEVERLRLQRAEDEKKLADLTASLREEKTARKQSDGQLTAVQEELTDLKTTCSSLERNLNERKRKVAEERKKTEDEMEEVKAGYEKDIQVLREKLRKQRTNTDVEAADKIAKMEEEMAADWQAKCDKLVAAANDKHARQMALVKDDLEEAQNRTTALEKKIQELRASSGSSDARIEDLQQQVEENAGFKEKYDSLRTQATAMKQRYEDRIAELDQEVETMGTRQQQLQQQLQQSKLQLQQQQQQTTAVSGGSSSSADVATEVKKVMNSVYQSLRAEFEADENYTGSEVMSVILGVIKETTLKLVQQPQGPTIQEEEESEEEEEEEEEEDEEEEEEEEEKEKQENQTPPTSELTSSALEDVANTTAPVMEANKSDAHSTQVPEIPAQPITRDEDNMNEDESTEETQAEDDLQRTAVHSNQSAQPSPPSSGPPADDDPAPPSEDLSTADSEAAAPPHSRGAETPAEDPQQIQPPPSETSSREDKSDKPAKPKADKPEETPLQTQHEVPVSANLTAERSSSGVSAERSSRSSTGAALPTLASREPPPLFDGEDNDDDSPLFGDDNMVADTLGPEVAVTPAGKEKTGGDKLTPRNDLLEDDLKPKPPPPLFGDDDDEDDLDWLS